MLLALSTRVRGSGTVGQMSRLIHDAFEPVVAATSCATDLGTSARALRTKWTRHRCQPTPWSTAEMAALRPSWAALVTNCTPPRPRPMCWPTRRFRPSTGARSGATIPWSGRSREVKRHADVAGIFPNNAAILRLVGMVLAEQHDERQIGRRYFSAESLAKLASLRTTDPAVGQVEVKPAALTLATC